MMPFVWSVCPKIGGLTVYAICQIEKFNGLITEKIIGYVWFVWGLFPVHDIVIKSDCKQL